MHGGVLTWHVIPYYTPDYLVLSGSLYDAAWYQTLRSTQSLEREDPYPFNVRLYQDLLTRNDPGPVMAGIDLVKIMRAQQPAFSSGGAVSSALHALVSLPPLQPLASGLLRFFYLSAMLWNPPAHPTIGPSSEFSDSIGDGCRMHSVKARSSATAPARHSMGQILPGPVPGWAKLP